MVILNTVFDAFSTEHNMTSGGGIISFEEMFFAGLGGQIKKPPGRRFITGLLTISVRKKILFASKTITPNS